MTEDQKRKSFLLSAPITARALREFASTQLSPYQADAKALALEAAESIERALELLQAENAKKPLA